MNSLIATLLSILTTVACLQYSNFAEDAVFKKEPNPTTSTAKAASKSMYPFRGTVTSVDVKALTVGLSRQEGGPRILHIGTETSLSRDGNDVTLESVKTGEYLKGRVERNASGEETIVKATVGAKPDRSDDDSKSKRSRKETDK
jgi:hypothetical protein